MLPIEFLEPNTEARIADVSGPDDETHRLREMGLREGVNVFVHQPGCPLVVGIDGNRLVIRAHAAVQVLVEPITATL